GRLRTRRDTCEPCGRCKPGLTARERIYMSIKLKFSGAPLGHEVQGVDLAHLSAGQFTEIENAFDTYGVIVFRGQKLTPDEQISFSAKFGKLELYPIGDFLLPGKPDIFVVSNIIENGKPVGMADAGSNWHSDMAFTEKPPRGSALYALEV